MRLILMTKILYGGEDRIRSGLPQTTQRGFLDCCPHFQEGLDVTRYATAFRNPLKYIEHGLETNPAWYTLAARLHPGERQKESGYVNHSCGLVHANQTAGPHHGSRLDQRIIVDRRIK